MNKVLVTGATGFVGRALVSGLREKGHSVVGLGSRDGQIDDPAIWERTVPGDVGWIFHLAGKIFVPDSWVDPLEFSRVNTLGALNVLEFGRRRKLPVTYVSSYLYGRPEKLPIDEDSPARPNDPYALSKWMAEQACEFYRRSYAMPITVLRPFNVYGPGQSSRLLVASVVRQALFEEVIAVQDLGPRRDYVYVDDLVEALLLTMGQPHPQGVYNIGSGESFSVQQVIDAVQRAAGTRKNVSCAQVTRPFEIDDVVADISRARKHLGWQPRHTFSEGIGKMVDAARRRLP